MNRILIIDDDHELVNLLKQILASEGFVADAADFHSGRAAALSGEYLLVVLESILPGGSGLEFLKQLRASSTVPVVLLGDGDGATDRILGLQMGADDYLAKPFEPRELGARIHAILRRTRDKSTEDGEIKVGDIALSPSRRAVVRAEIPVQLTAVEFNVLECLLRNAGSIVTRQTLAEKALGRRLAAFDRSVDVHVHNVRKKISSSADERIKTIRGVGYLYAPPREDGE
jgi:two-component system, OmpR family, response regulator